jgi:hypothetical protein
MTHGERQAAQRKADRLHDQFEPGGEPPAVVLPLTRRSPCVRRYMGWSGESSHQGIDGMAL